MAPSPGCELVSAAGYEIGSADKVLIKPDLPNPKIRVAVSNQQKIASLREHHTVQSGP